MSLLCSPFAMDVNKYSSSSTYVPPADIVTGSIVPTFTELSLLTTILILETSSERGVVEIYVHNNIIPMQKIHKPHPHLLKPREQFLVVSLSSWLYYQGKWKTILTVRAKDDVCITMQHLGGGTGHRNNYCFQFRYFEITFESLAKCPSV